MNLNLSCIPDELREMAREAFASDKPTSFLCYADNMDCLALVSANRRQLQQRGVYEAALLDSFTGCRVNNTHFPQSELEWLFSLADRKQLLAAGDPLPDGNRFTIYRGVAGNRPYRRVCGYSWTLDYERAVWFAERGRLFGLHDPAVYRASVRRSDILAYYNGRKEQEIICRPRSYRRVATIEARTAA